MNIIFFITHKTLDFNNCFLTFLSLTLQNTSKIFDLMYIYNSHQNELNNNIILKLFYDFKLNVLIKDVKIFEYNDCTHKSLGGDIECIRNFAILNFNPLDRILFLKSDCLLSKHFFSDVLTIDDKIDKVFYTAPFICAKKRVDNLEIINYCLRNYFIKSDEITFFVEDANNSKDNDFYNRQNTSIFDFNIKFTSCLVFRDWSCHFISVNLLNLLNINKQSWGGVNLSRLNDFLITSNNSFVVHKYHDIISENRNTDREGPVKDWLLS